MKDEIKSAKADGNIHVIPREGIAHYENENCFCRPTWDEQNKKDYQSGEAKTKVFVHKTKQELEQ